MMPNLQKLPLTLSTFHILRSREYLYVDKTRHAYNLITGDDLRFFLSRPRRFGKSLFVSMLHEVLTGNRDLFKGLWIEQSDYGWQEHGMIMLDFSLFNAKTDQVFEESLCKAIARSLYSYGFDMSVNNTVPEMALDETVRALYEKFGRVAILIDEYDSPILKTLHKKEQAVAIRDSIRSFFTALKGLDAYIDFVFITGVSSFAKAGIFSGMNNLHIITLEDEFADICGYTEVELDVYFKEYIQQWADQDAVSYDQQRKKIKDWYNGYRFSRDVVHVYSPFSLMKSLKLRRFENFWVDSGTPTFLIEELKRQRKESLQEFEAIVSPASFHLSRSALGTFDVGLTPLPELMFQAGYFTIVDHNRSEDSYQLGYPNHEVERALYMYWLSIATQLETTPFFKRVDHALEITGISESIS